MSTFSSLAARRTLFDALLETESGCMYADDEQALIAVF